MKKLLLSVAFISFVSFANAQCQAGFTFTVSGDTVLIYDASTHSGPVNYTIDFGDGYGGSWMNNIPSPLRNYYPYAGKYNVCMTISDTNPSTCHSTFCDSITITAGAPYPCNAAFTYFVDTSSTFPIRFQNSMLPYYGSKWLWNFGDGSYDSTSGNSTEHQYATAGIYYVCLTTTTNTGAVCTYCDTISAIPCASLLNVTFNKNLNGNTASFTSYCSGSTLTNPYYWSFGDGTTSNSQNATHTYLYNGTYSVCLTYRGDNMGCYKTVCDTITINNAALLPCNALFSYYPDTMAVNSLHFYDLSSTDIVGWSWSFPGGTPSTSNSQGVSVAYAAPGTYTAYLTVANQSGVTCSYSNTVNVGSSCSNTSAYFSMSPAGTPHVWNVVNMATGTPPITYSWNWGDGSAYSSGPNPSHTYAQAGWYNICLTIADANGCGSSYCTYDTLYKYSPESIISIYVTSPTGVNDVSALATEVSVYPNPANNNITIQAPQNASIEISNIEGQLTGNFVMNNSKASLDVSAYPCGVYLVKVKTENGIAVKRFVKE